MQELHDLAQELHAAAKALEAAAQKDTQALQARRALSAALDRGRAALKVLDHIGFEPDDFDRESVLWKQARIVAEGRRILSNNLSIAAQSMFTAPDPTAMQRDLNRAVAGLRRHAELEADLVASAATARVA